MIRWTTSASSLLLSQLVYYNTWFSLIQVFFGVGVIAYKVRWLEMENIMAILVPLLTALWVLVEPARLWLGYSGNLRERVPELAAFLLLTVVPQFLVLIFLGFVPSRRFPIETIIVVPQLIFLILEFVTAYYTVRQFMARQTAAFFRSVQEEGVEAEAQQNQQQQQQQHLLYHRNVAHFGSSAATTPTATAATPPVPPQTRVSVEMAPVVEEGDGGSSLRRRPGAAAHDDDPYS